MARYIILYKIAHQMWQNHSFFQRAKTAENALRLGVGGKDREGEGVGKIWGRQYKRGVFIK